MAEEIVTAPKISVLVPIYNVERYLRQCLDSLVGQTLKEIEIILLNDGSTDASGAICDEYAAKDARIRVIHKPNSGYGATMNVGLRAAQGEYIGILESDDWTEPNMYETLYSLAKEHDVQVVKSNYYRYTENKGNTLLTIFPQKDYECVVNPKVSSEIFFSHACIWCAIYKRSFLEEKDIRFLETPGASYQDTSFNFKVWATVEKVWLTSEAFVHYRCDRDESSVRSKGKVFFIRDEWDEIERYMERYPEEKKASAILRTHCKFRNYMWNLRRLEGKEKKLFGRYFWGEYKKAWRRGELRLMHTSFHEQLRYMKSISPNPLKWALLRLLLAFFRIFVKRKVRNNREKWSILFGLIRRDGRVIENRLPTFWEGKA